MGRYVMRFINATAFIRRISKKKLIATAVLLLCLLIAFIVLKTGVNVTYVLCDSVQHKVISVTAEPEKIVEMAGINLEGDNILVLDYFEPKENENLIIVAAPHDVLIYEAGKKIASVNVAGTVKTALDKAGIKLRDGDSTNFGEDVGITEDMKIEITRAFPVTIKVDGEERTVKTTGGTVENIIRQAGISLGSFDEISKKLSKNLTKKTTLTIKRVEYKTETKTVNTNFKTIVEYDSTMYNDQRKVKRKGVLGKSINEYKYTYTDGKLTHTDVLSSKTIKEPVAQILIKGTKSRPINYSSVKTGKVISEIKPPYEIPLDKKGRPTKYKKVITGKATAYCTGTTCSTGAPAMPGRVAVDPREIPYGTKMYIVSSDGKWNYGYCIASDTGGFIYNSSTVVDLYMRGYSTCRNFGRRNVDIYILEWGNGIKNWKTH